MSLSSNRSVIIVLFSVVILLAGSFSYLYMLNLDLMEKLEKQRSQINSLETRVSELNSKIDDLNRLVSQIIGSEKISITAAYASSQDNGWTITLKGFNNGRNDIILVRITLNGKPLSSYPSSSATIEAASSTYSYNKDVPIKLPAGSGFKVTIYVDGGFSSGQTVEVGLVSVLGTTFKRTVVLP